MAEPTIALDQIDPDAQKVIHRLVRNGYEAYLVGGCVRDLLLSRRPKDFDIATSATPAEVRDLFRNCRIIGRRFRLAHILFGSKVIETATFRANPREVLGDEDLEGDTGAKEAEEEDLLIHRDNVFGTAEEDARRRDFTINGLFYDLIPGQVIDYVSGVTDLKARSIRTIGDPDIRFREDPIRILRAIKFAARLGFDIEDDTYQGVITHREEISKSAPPRVLEEVYRLLRGGAAQESLFLMQETGVLEVLLPKVAKRLQEDPLVLDPFFQAVDTLVGKGEVPANALLLIFLLGPDLAPFFEEGMVERSGDPGPAVDALFGPLFEKLRVTRRDMERTRLILVAQRRVWQLRRRPSRGGILQRDWFQDAMTAHALYRMARGATSEVDIWGDLRSLRMSIPHIPRRFLQGGRGREDAQTVADALDDGEAGRRRRGGRSRSMPPVAPRPKGPAPAKSPPVGSRASVDLGEDEPLENEEAALRIFDAAMNAADLDE